MTVSKFHLFWHTDKAPAYYSTGLRPASVLHSRMRYGFSALRAHLFTHHIIPDTACQCGHEWEDTLHFFTECPIYAAQRVVMIDQLESCITNVNNMSNNQICALLLYGLNTFSPSVNSVIFIAAQNYILSTERFRIPG